MKYEILSFADSNSPFDRWYDSDAGKQLPVSRDEVTDHLRLGDDWDGVVEDQLMLFAQAATDYAEEATSSSLMPRTIRATFDQGDSLKLPRGPVQGITTVTDTASNPVAYEQRTIGNHVEILAKRHFAWPLIVTYMAGYVNGRIPASLKLGILMHISTLFSTRESITDKQMIPVPHALNDFYRLHNRSAGIG